MKRGILAIALAACALIAHAVYDTMVTPVVNLAYSIGVRLKAWTAEAFALAASQPGTPSRPVVLLVKARAFVARLAKRERPVLTASWRMCPSG